MTHDFPLAMPFGSLNSEVIEVLERTKHNLDNPDMPWRFLDWTTCTCGHIYMAAVGKIAQDNMAILGDYVTDETVYGKSLIAVAEALGCTDWSPRRAWSAAAFISGVTSAKIDGAEEGLVDPEMYEVNGGEHMPSRKAAKVVIDEAIDAIRAAEAEAQREVLARAMA